MILTIQSVHVKVDKAFEDFANEKFAKLEKFFFGEPTIHLIIKKERFTFIVESEVKSKTDSIFIKETSEDLSTCVTRIVEKLKNKVSKLHEKKIDIAHKSELKNLT
ncbi:MAG: ribosome-associated translation inhibitor RaiA [Candidatus Omnitrophica bacterium]|nr:ribosome-associated translation inhibitor RaiA [Candidatus Omnitrophota bacterium]